MKVLFVVLEPESKRGSYEVPLPIVIGRGSEARFRIQQDRISRKHCELFDRDGDVYLRDLGSTNGTFLDGEQVAASIRTPVPPGSVLRVGTIEIRIDYEGSGRLVRANPAGIEDATIGFTPASDEELAEAQPFLEEEEPQAEAAELLRSSEESVEEPVQIETATDSSQAVDATAFLETQKAPEPGDFGSLEVEEPAIEAFTGAGFGEPQPEADVSGGSFDFLGGQPEAGPADDDQLGDFFKGIK